jgi:hypothetical protein
MILALRVRGKSRRVDEIMPQNRSVDAPAFDKDFRQIYALPVLMYNRVTDYES